MAGNAGRLRTKLPPLPWWLAERPIGCSARMWRSTHWRSVAVILAFVAVSATARPLVGPLGALVAVLIVDGLHYLHYPPPSSITT